MGCNNSKEGEVQNPRMHPIRASGLDHMPDDLASDLVQHTVVKDIADTFDFHEVIGQGSFGSVMKATNKKTNKTWAVKVVELNNELDKKALLNEIGIVKRLQHPNIVRVIASYEDSKRMYMVMQLLPGAELFTHLHVRGRHFTEVEVRKLILCLLRAISYLHSNQITVCMLLLLLHRISSHPFNNMAVHSSSVSPFHGDTNDDTMNKIFDGLKPSFFHGDVWQTVSPDCINFIKSLIQEDPAGIDILALVVKSESFVVERLSAEQALNHRWIRTSAAGVIDDNKRHLFMKMVAFGKNCNQLKSTAMLSVAMGVSEEHIKPEIVSEVFHSMDKDKDGTLNADEFCAALEEYGIGHEEALSVFARMDQRGKINYIEFVAAVLDEFGDDTMKEAFAILDAEKTGRISVVGLQSVFKNAKESDLKAMVASADVKGNGSVDFEEFKLMFTDIAAPPIHSGTTNFAAQSSQAALLGAGDSGVHDAEVSGRTL
ncbi:hypothetical protein DYB37_002712 [Aphanomyces astaci]|uniref:non-specific serine/threonine protein kinase n=1 Tax=Aphanomyces astaci TaxID=112090 RepID=A0A3R7BQ08_APHAT|nr:hypothetical protein DYB37_002712 [Aphanomyces astaci]